ncbi:hypothetical protein C8R42DRAFT_772930 [Lentinula raphanica]|nr:hypothetical protein C8R42DRAFT_772930 [Lentinula raphanica]
MSTETTATLLESLNMQLEELETKRAKFKKTSTNLREKKFPGVTVQTLDKDIAQVQSQIQGISKRDLNSLWLFDRVWIDVQCLVQTTSMAQPGAGMNIDPTLQQLAGAINRSGSSGTSETIGDFSNNTNHTEDVSMFDMEAHKKKALQEFKDDPQSKSRRMRMSDIVSDITAGVSIG